MNAEKAKVGKWVTDHKLLATLYTSDKCQRSVLSSVLVGQTLNRTHNLIYLCVMCGPWIREFFSMKPNYRSMYSITNAHTHTYTPTHTHTHGTHTHTHAHTHKTHTNTQTHTQKLSLKVIFLCLPCKLYKANGTNTGHGSILTGRRKLTYGWDSTFTHTHRPTQMLLLVQLMGPDSLLMTGNILSIQCSLIEWDYLFNILEPELCNPQILKLPPKLKISISKYVFFEVAVI